MSAPNHVVGFQEMSRSKPANGNVSIRKRGGVSHRSQCRRVPGFVEIAQQVLARTVQGLARPNRLRSVARDLHATVRKGPKPSRLRARRRDSSGQQKRQGFGKVRHRPARPIGFLDNSLDRLADRMCDLSDIGLVDPMPKATVQTTIRRLC